MNNVAEVIYFIKQEKRRMSKFIFGVDLGGTTVKMGLFDKDGCVLDKWEIPTIKDNEGAAVLPDVAESILAKMKEKNIIRILMVQCLLDGNK